MPETTTLHELRSTSRTHLFVGAVLKTPSGHCTARVRNISRTGALVEAAILPDTGTPVSLVRGSLSAEGRTVWRSGSRCGIAFSSDVVVDAWLPDGNSRQARVDALLRDIRNDNAAYEEVSSLAHHGEGSGSKEILAELASILGTQLASDPLIVARFSTELQGLDLLAQALEARNQPDGIRRLAHTVSACGEILGRLKAAAAVADAHDSIRNGAVPGSLGNHSLTIPIDHVPARF
jgi:hypothetical protein